MCLGVAGAGGVSDTVSVSAHGLYNQSWGGPGLKH